MTDGIDRSRWFRPRQARLVGQAPVRLPDQPQGDGLLPGRRDRRAGRRRSSELERTLRLADDVVRHKLIRLPDAEAERRGMAGAAA